MDTASSSTPSHSKPASATGRHVSDIEEFDLLCGVDIGEVVLRRQRRQLLEQYLVLVARRAGELLGQREEDMPVPPSEQETVDDQARISDAGGIRPSDSPACSP